MSKIIPESWKVPPWCDAEFGGGILDEKIHVAVGRNDDGTMVLKIDKHIVHATPAGVEHLIAILNRGLKAMRR